MRSVIILLTLSWPCFLLAQQQYKVAVIAFYNLENFYDTINNPAVNDDDFTPSGIKHYTAGVYKDKLQHMATVIAQIGTDINPDGPAIIGVAEIENDTVLNDLIQHPLLKSRHYKIVHYDSHDLRGVDVALLFNPKYFTPEDSRKLFVKIPAGTKQNIFTRDVLWVKGKLDGETVHVLVNHWPSRLGGEERSEPGRNAAALVNKQFIDSIRQADSAAKFVVMGDLNDDPVNTSVTKILGAKWNADQTKPNELFNPWAALYKHGNGTLAFNDTWGLFDQIIISQSWLDKMQPGFFYYRAAIFNRQFMIENMGRYKGYPMRTWDGNTYRGGYSDHFPTYIVLLKKLQ